MYGINNENNDDKESTEKEVVNNKTNHLIKINSNDSNSNSYPFTKLSKFVYSILASKLSVKNENRKEEFKVHVEFKSKIFESLLQEQYENFDTNQINSFKQKKFSKLVNLFQTCENYYSIMMLNGSANTEMEFINSNSENSFKSLINNKKEFYLCGLCYYYLNDPVTLICGCTFCKCCLDEYNQSQFQIAVLKQYLDPSKHLYKCKNCGFSHNQNSSQNLSTNIFITKILDKGLPPMPDTRLLRNDIRKCIYLKIIDYVKAIRLMERALSLDEKNHLILVDLFFLNFFNQTYENCHIIVEKLLKLAPDWPLTYFINSLCNQLKQDFNNMGIDLITCLQLDSNLDYVKSKLFKLSTYLKKNELDNSILEDYFQSTFTQGDKEYIEEQNSCTKKNIQGKFISNLIDNRLPNSKNEELKQVKNSIIDGFCKSIKLSDMECSLCYRLLYNPVSTPCGHVFCCACLDRSLDHKDKCPLCKRSLSDYLAERRQFTTEFLDDMIKVCFPNEYNERKLQYEEELSDLIKNEHEIPIFVCTLALPGVKCPLHIYEPRYRLMLRRALATTKQFGMCVYLENNDYANYGCMLEIKKAQFLRDGRALIDTVGGRRFKIVRKNIKDGYNIADVEWLRDIKIINKEALNKLNKEVYDLSRQWYDQLPNEQKLKILESFGISQIPTMDENIEYSDNGPDWHWFLLHILPLDTEFQLKFLSTTSLMARLSQLKMILRILLKSCEKDINNKTDQSNIQAPNIEKRDN